MRRMRRFSDEQTPNWYRAAIDPTAISVRGYCAEAGTTKNRGRSGYLTPSLGGSAACDWRVVF